MLKEEEPIPVNIRLRNVEIIANQGYQQRVDQVVQKFTKYFPPFANIRFARPLAPQPRRSKPFYVANLRSVSLISDIVRPGQGDSTFSPWTNS